MTLKNMCLSPSPKDLCSTLAVRMRQWQGDIDVQHVDSEARF